MTDTTRPPLGERISAAVTPNLFKTDGTIAQEQTRSTIDEAQAKLEPDSEKSYIQHVSDSLRGLTSNLHLHLPHQFTTDTPLCGELLMPDDDEKEESTSKKSYIQKVADSLRGLTSNFHLPHQFTIDSPLSGELLDDDDDDNQAADTDESFTERIVHKAQEKVTPLVKTDSKVWEAVIGQGTGKETNTSMTDEQGQQDHGLVEGATGVLGFGIGSE